MATTRRQLLGAAAGLVVAGCARPDAKAQPVSRRTGVVLHIRNDALTLAAPAIRNAWKETHPAISLDIQPLRPMPGLTGSSSTTPLQWTTADLLKTDDVFQLEGDGGAGPGPAQVLDLTPLLRARNFAPSNITALTSFTFEGKQYGLPLWVEPMALLVNTKLAASVGIAQPSGAWTLNAMEAGVSQAVSQHGRVMQNLIVGYPWTDLRIWGAFVLGFGGRLTNSDSGVDFSGPVVAAATSRLMSLAEQAGWYSGVGTGHTELVPNDFTGPVANALFAIENVPVYFRGKTHGGLSFTRFPLLPIYPLIPVANSYGLAVSPQSKHIDAAMTFMLWLYEPAQQKALMAVGVPPIVQDPALESAFQSEKSLPPNVPDIADPRHLQDVAAPLPQIVEGTGYSRTLAVGLTKALKDPTTTASQLAQIQSALQQQISNTATACAKVPTPPKC